MLKEEHHFIAPNFLFTEIFKHKEKILKHSKLSETELLELLNDILSTIQFIHYDFISTESLKKAILLCQDVDMKDMIFVALSIELNAVLWTGDRKLKEGITAKGFNQFFSSSKS